MSSKPDRTESRTAASRVVSTDEHAWDVTCWNLAIKRDCFAILAVTDFHDIFYSALCEHHAYQMKEQDGKVLFSPFPICGPAPQ
jgi:hypothetical protein